MKPVLLCVCMCDSNVFLIMGFGQKGSGSTDLVQERGFDLIRPQGP